MAMTYLNSMGEEDLHLCFETALGLVRTAGLEIAKSFHSSKTVCMKSGEIDLVTETDQYVEGLIKEGLRSQFPGHRFIGEETSNEKASLTDMPTWILDPVDGTMNFVHSFPHTCVSLAFWVDKEPQIGIIYNPISGDLYTARKNQGAFLNGFPIHVSRQTDLAKSLLMTETGTSRDEIKMKAVKDNLEALIPKVHGVRMLGAAALDMTQVATGAAEIYFEYGIHIWDMAAAVLIVTEAGGVVADTTGGNLDPLNRRVIVAANKELVDQIVPLLHHVHLETD